jgi:hypothetical protein
MKRSVLFDEEKTCFHDGAIMDIAHMEKADIWYQQADMSHMKRKALVVSKEANQYGFGSLLTNTYGKIDDATQEALNAWSRSGNSRRGLERWINQEYAAKRSDIRRRTIKSVLRAQDKMRKENLTEPGYTSKVLSRLSEAFSRDSYNFARGMGIADEQALIGIDEVGTPKEFHSSRTRSPDSVMAPPPLAKRYPSLGLSATSGSDMRHYY